MPAILAGGKGHGQCGARSAPGEGWHQARTASWSHRADQYHEWPYRFYRREIAVWTLEAWVINLPVPRPGQASAGHPRVAQDRGDVMADNKSMVLYAASYESAS